MGAPQKPVAKYYQITGMTKAIKALEAKLLSDPKNFHDKQAKKSFERKVNERGILLEAIATEAPELWSQAVAQIVAEPEGE